MISLFILKYIECLNKNYISNDFTNNYTAKRKNLISEIGQESIKIS